MKLLKQFALPVVCAIIILAGCSSPSKLYQKGDYYRACDRAISSLRSKPSDAESKQVLLSAYPKLIADIDRQSEMLKPLNTINKCDIVIGNYTRLSKIHQEIMHCPAAMEVIAYPVNGQDVIEQTKLIAAQILYDDGSQALHIGTIDQARRALYMFKKLNTYAPGYKNVNALIGEATYKATLRVVVLKPQISTRYELDADFFYGKLMNDINKRSYHNLTKFYTPEQAEKQHIDPHQIFVIEFIDFVVGNTRQTEKTTDVKRENVELNKGIFGTASGKYTLHRLEIISSGALGMRVVNPADKKVINQRRFDSQSVWATQWASFSGDDRALSNDQRSLVGRRAQPVPTAQQLFASFADPLYAQVASYINVVYPYYK